jgi:hypothetical protein
VLTASEIIESKRSVDGKSKICVKPLTTRISVVSTAMNQKNNASQTRRQAQYGGTGFGHQSRPALPV